MQTGNSICLDQCLIFIRVGVLPLLAERLSKIESYYKEYNTFNPVLVTFHTGKNAHFRCADFAVEQEENQE